MDSTETLKIEAIPHSEAIPPLVRLPIHPSEDPSSQGKAFLALCGAMLWPGVGHFIAGSFNLGLIWFTLALSTAVGIFAVLFQYPQSIWTLKFLAPLAVLIALAQLLDAIRAGKKSKQAMLWEPTVRYIAGLMLVLAALAAQHSVITYLQENVFEICYTPTPSMSPNLIEGDRFLTLKGLPIHRWDIVGFNAPAGLYPPEVKNLMKRVVGMPGDRVEITGAGLMINGKLTDLPGDAGPYFPMDMFAQRLTAPSPAMAGNGCWGKPITLGPDEYFLLGDNTFESGDARFWPSIEGHIPGAMPVDQITSTVVAICWPQARWRLFPPLAH